MKLPLNHNIPAYLRKRPNSANPGNSAAHHADMEDAKHQEHLDYLVRAQSNALASDAYNQAIKNSAQQAGNSANVLREDDELAQQLIQRAVQTKQPIQAGMFWEELVSLAFDLLLVVGVIAGVIYLLSDYAN